jgi:hypothetical protein
MIAGAVVSSQTAPQVLNEGAKLHAQRFPGEPMVLVGPIGRPTPITIAELTQKADVVLHARLFKLKTYIGRDGEHVLTDWAIRDSNLLAARTDSAMARAMDATKPLVVTMYGGELTIEGVRVVASPAEKRSVVDGGEYLVFLMPSRGGGDRYEPYHDGVFAVEEGKVKPLVRDAGNIFKDAADAPLATVLATVQEARIR